MTNYTKSFIYLLLTFLLTCYTLFVLSLIMAAKKFDRLSSEFREQLKHIVTEIGVFQTAKKYHERAGMSFDAFYKQIKSNYGKKPELNSKGKEKKPLSEVEEKFLVDLGEGKVSLVDASKLIAVKVFRKILENPDDVKFIDFFRTELLKLKSEENKIKETWSKEIIARMFAGKLPPEDCPHCGKPTVADSPKLLNGEEKIYEPETINSNT